jgi:hypothetical protein
MDWLDLFLIVLAIAIFAVVMAKVVDFFYDYLYGLDK